LYLADAPYLRQIFVWGDCDRSWARRVPEIEALGGSSSVDDDFLAAIERAVTPSDSLVIVYTSGSTADPKGVLHTHGTVLRHSRELATLRGLRESDRVWLPMPLFWIGGVAFGLLGNMHVGATSVFDAPFEAGRTLEMLERERVTISTAWPHYVKALQDHPDFERRDLSAFRSGDTVDALQPRPERDLGLQAQPFGMTETCGPHTFGDMTKDLPEKLRGSFGIPLTGVEHKIVDPGTGESLPEGAKGEICVRGWSLMQGLYKKEREETFDPDGYYHTGDGGYLEHGSLYFTGRLGDMIKTGGANVAPSEVEAVILECPEVLEAYVAGVPDSIRGEIVAAAVVLGPRQQLAGEELRRRLKSQLSAFKLPKLLAFFEEGTLPYRANGKIDKPGLEAVLADRMRENGAQD
jgi:acyl-coenzyme A synthetase/AMP-(fatty) acid ligase